MVQKVTTTIEDDLDGGDADEVVTFALDGIEYTIDLSSRNARALRDALSPYIDAGRKVSGAPRKATGTRVRVLPADANGDVVRQWAASQGIAVAARGRIPADVRRQFEAAHRGTKITAPADDAAVRERDVTEETVTEIFSEMPLVPEVEFAG